MNSCFNKIVLVIFVLFFLVGCKSKNIKNTKTSFFKDEVFACYYHDKFNGRNTASGEKFSNNKLTAAHKKLPFNTKVRVTNLENNKSVDVVINDRGPFSKGLEIDLSKKAFMSITDDTNKGKIKVSIQLLE